jgi:hypothetical protein
MQRSALFYLNLYPRTMAGTALQGDCLLTGMLGRALKLSFFLPLPERVWVSPTPFRTLNGIFTCGKDGWSVKLTANVHLMRYQVYVDLYLHILLRILVDELMVVPAILWLSAMYVYGNSWLKKYSFKIFSLWFKCGFFTPVNEIVGWNGISKKKVKGDLSFWKKSELDRKER